MRAVNVTELRNHLPEYLGIVKDGEELLVTARGKVVARLLPPLDPKANAKDQLLALRERCRLGDVTSPLGDRWDAEDGPS